MFGKTVISLPRENRGKFCYDEKKINKLLEDVSELLEKVDSNDINNAYLEPFINSRIYKKDEVDNILNGFKFISKNWVINPDSLRELFKILSKNLPDLDLSGMGYYYRNCNEYVFEEGPFFGSFTRQIDPSNVDSYMNSLLNYVNSKSKMDFFIKSQIIHLYFVYVHPYADVNGRTSRMLSSWFLQRNGLDKYLLFNRIPMINHNYNSIVKKSIKSGNFTYYLEFVLSEMKKELEKILYINNINDITSDEKIVLKYIYFIMPFSTLDKLSRRLGNRFNQEKLASIIMSLQEKGYVKVDEIGRININYKTGSKENMKQIQ